MPTTVSIDLTDDQEAYIRELVETGEFASADAVMRQGLEHLRADREAMPDIDANAMRALLEERRKGPFISMEESERRIEDMFARKRREHGVPG